MNLQPDANEQNVNHNESALDRLPGLSLDDVDNERLGDLASLDGRKVKWALMFAQDKEFYLYLKDIDVIRDPSNELARELFSLRKVGELSTFEFLDLPPEVQLHILNKLSMPDLSACRLVCRWMNELIVKNWHSLPPRRIGCVDFIPNCTEVWGLYFDYNRKLASFANVIISRLVLYYGEITSSLILSLAEVLVQAKIIVKRVIIHNCSCSCEAEDLVAFVKKAHVEVLAIDVCDMENFGKSILLHEAIQKLRCVCFFSNGDDVMSGIIMDPLYYDQPLDLHGLCRLLADWGNGTMEILHFHMYSDAEWAADAESILQELEHVCSRRGDVIRNLDNQALRLEVKNGRVTFSVVEA